MAFAADKLKGIRVVSFESRRSQEMQNLLQKHGADVHVAPSMREIPIEDQHEAIAFGQSLKTSGCDVLILLTGVGTRMLVDAMALSWPKEEVLNWLRQVTLVCRGPKPVAVLKELGLEPDVRVPEPNTWRELLVTLDSEVPIQGRTVAVQEYGRSNPMLIQGLNDRGAHVRRVPVYAWAMPEDITALTEAVKAIVASQRDVALFTSATQVDHVIQCAKQLGLDTECITKLLTEMAVASIGPITTEVLHSYGLQADIVPKHPKMGHLVMAVAEQAHAVLAQKRAMESACQGP